MRRIAIAITALTVVAAPSAHTQNVQVNRSNKTITVTSDEKVSMPAEIAKLKVGYHSYAATSDAAFNEVAAAGNKITDSLVRAGIKVSEIESSDITLAIASPEQAWTDEMKRSRLYEGSQSWKFRVPANRAELFLNSAADAGANDIEAPEWDVADPSALQAKASAAALQKARKVAEQMATGLGAHLGELVYASNRVPATWPYANGAMNTEEAVQVSDSPAVQPPKPVLKLFPGKVESSATVYAVFAID